MELLQRAFDELLAEKCTQVTLSNYNSKEFEQKTKPKWPRNGISTLEHRVLQCSKLLTNPFKEIVRFTLKNVRMEEGPAF